MNDRMNFYNFIFDLFLCGVFSCSISAFPFSLSGLGFWIFSEIAIHSSRCSL
uniref:Uncharacterized protein n=1 Tax=Rhizophora mucronata TaxID=61149 RepID=A0A2P2QFW3_RHIMU